MGSDSNHSLGIGNTSWRAWARIADTVSLVCTFALLHASPSLAAEAGFCRSVNGAVTKVAGAMGGVAGVGGVAKAVGLAAVEHSSGALIATRGGAYVANTLGAVGTVVATVTSPAVIAGAATVAEVGTTMVTVCRFQKDVATTPPSSRAAPKASSAW